MAELTYRDAVARGIAQEMTRDPDVIFFGEDVGKPGGVFKTTVGLYEQFGKKRVRDCPISEQAILGAAMGAAALAAGSAGMMAAATRTLAQNTVKLELWSRQDPSGPLRPAMW